MRLLEIIDLRSLPACIRRVRKHSRLTVRQAARRARVSRSTFHRVESGETCDARTYIRISAWALYALRLIEYEIAKATSAEPNSPNPREE